MITSSMDQPRRAAGVIASIIGGTARRLLATYRLGGDAVIAAPLIVALAMLPELIQHAVEIKLGMFESLAMFRAHGADALRMGFGYAKVAGFTLAILGVARFWAVGGVLTQTIKVPLRDVGRLALAIALAVIQSVAFRQMQAQDIAPAWLLATASLIFQASLSLYMVGAVLGDERATLRWTLTNGWPRALFMTLLLAATFAPCQMLHTANHRLAIGSPAAATWALMAFDGLFVGLFAALVGSAMYVGYRFGPSWRGWDRLLDLESKSAIPRSR
jgi:hypothetical protein